MSRQSLRDLAARERAMCVVRNDTMRRAVAVAEAGKVVPVSIVKRIVDLDSHIGVLVEIQMAMEMRRGSGAA